MCIQIRGSLSKYRTTPSFNRLLGANGVTVWHGFHLHTGRIQSRNFYDELLGRAIPIGNNRVAHLATSKARVDMLRSVIMNRDKHVRLPEPSPKAYLPFFR